MNQNDINKRLLSLTIELNKELKKDNPNNIILWFQILVPDSYRLFDIVGYHIRVEEISLEKSKEFVSKFVTGSNEGIRRSLYFHRYNDSYKYTSFKSDLFLSKPFRNRYDFEPEEQLDLEDIFSNESLYNTLTDDNHINNHWNAWKKNLEKHFVGKSTMWSYIDLDNKSKLGSSTIFSAYAVFNEKIKDENLKSKINRQLQKLLIEIGFENFRSELRVTALQSSLTTVAARNQSHNFGSHVLNNLSDPENIKEFIKENFYQSLYNPSNSDDSKIQNQIRYVLFENDDNGRELENVSKFITKQDLQPQNLIAVFNTYLKARMDFIADIGTTTQAVILQPAFLYQDIFSQFEKNLILLREISGKEDNFKYRFDLKFKNENCDVGPVVAMPNAILGQQAFYIILENIIRNTAKHDSRKDNDAVTFTINTKEGIGKTKDYFEISIISSIHQENIDDLVGKRNQSINDKVLSEENIIRDGSWGTIEMKLAAAYLCGLSITSIDNDEYKTDFNHEKYFPIIEAINEGNRFGYKFYLQKPKIALIAFEKNDQEVIDDINDKSGFKALCIKNESLDNKIYQHDFLVYVGDDFDAELAKKRNLPQRVLNFRKVEFDSFGESLEEKFLELYISKLNKVLKINLEEIDSKGLEFTRSGETNKLKAFFDRHATEYERKKNNSPNVVFIEPHSSVSSIALLLNKNDFINSQGFKLRALEAVFTKIVVIDERSQTTVSKKYFGDNTVIPLGHIYRKTGVHIPFRNYKQYEQVKAINYKIEFEEPNMFANLIANNIKNEKQDILNFIDYHKADTDYLVIHFGILEKLSNSKELKDILTDIRSKLDKDNTRIVIVSGRGQTPDIPKDEFFVNQSSFAFFLSDQYGRSKYHLVQLLKNCRINN